MKLPSNCVNIYDPTTWEEIRSYIKRVIPIHEWRRMRRVPAELIHEDNLKKHLESIATVEYSVNLFLQVNDYSFVGTHCCRPLSMRPYFSEGFEPLSQRRSRGLVIEYTSGCLSEKDLATIFENTDLIVRSDRLCFSTGYPNDVDNHSRHYLLRGPEFFDAILSPLNPISSELKQKISSELDGSLIRGIPTIFTVAVPFASMSERGKREMVYHLIAAQLWLSSTRPRLPCDWDKGGAMICSHRVPASAIISHEHPREIPNHIFFGEVVTGHATKCDFCP